MTEATAPKEVMTWGEERIARIPAVREVAPQPMSETTALLAVIERAARDPSVDVGKMRELFDMRRELQKESGAREFNAAVSAAKGEIGPIFKNRAVDFTSAKGRTNYRYEDMAEVARTVDPVLAKFGLGYRYRTVQDGTMIRVTCILFHRDGHQEETTLEGRQDESGNKNQIQGVGSTVTFLERYTLKAALGLASSADDDGRASSSGPSTISDAQIETLQREIMDTNASLPKFLKGFSIETLADLPAREFKNAMAVLADRRNRQPKEA